ncbi:MAG TPA: DinB family protein, partial [Acidimicrobiales bacterium]|nr:DinB family protein [Acidimicrobiales bacterium]
NDFPPLVADEQTMLASWLDFHRRTLLGKCDGLGPEQLAARSVPPSTLSLLGLVRHMAEVEEHWFCRVFLDEKLPRRYTSRDDPDGAFDGASADNAADGFAAFDAGCARARLVVAGVGSLDEVGRRRFGDHDVSMRWILVHMIEEYARHNGHADLLRQAIDGAVG